jgi:hypothetical protein
MKRHMDTEKPATIAMAYACDGVLNLLVEQEDGTTYVLNLTLAHSDHRGADVAAYILHPVSARGQRAAGMI